MDGHKALCVREPAAVPRRPEVRQPADSVARAGPRVDRDRPSQICDVAMLQRMIGNAAVSTMIVSRDRDANPPPSAGASGAHSDEARPSAAPPVPAEVHRFSFDGRLYELGPAEFQVVLDTAAERLRSHLLVEATARFDGLIELYNHHVSNYNDQRAVGWLLEMTSGAELPDSAVQLARTSLAQSRAAVAGLHPPTQEGLRAATASLASTELHLNAAAREMKEYGDRIVGSGENWVIGLEITRTAAFTVACVAGGAVLAAPAVAGGLGLGAASSGAIMGSATSLVAAMSTTIGRAAADEELHAVDELLGWGKSALMGALAGGSGGAIASKVAGPLASRLAAQLGPTFPAVPTEVLQVTIRNAIEGGTSNAVQGALTDTVGAMEGTVSTEQFLTNLGANLLAGGLAGLVQGRLRGRHDWRQIAGSSPGGQAVLW